jgi:hypothetical protein
MKVTRLLRCAALVLIGASAGLFAGCQEDKPAPLPPATVEGGSAPAAAAGAAKKPAAPSPNAGSSASGARMPQIGEK